MALTITHATTATADDGTSDVNAAEWNAAHTVAGTITGANIAADVALAGNPTTTTQTPGNATTRIATTAFVDAAVAAVSGGTIADNAVTNAKLADVATATIKGRTTAGTGDPQDLTAAQARALLSVYTQAEVDAAIAAGGGGAPDIDAGTTADMNSAHFLRADEAGGVEFAALNVDAGILTTGQTNTTLVLAADGLGGVMLRPEESPASVADGIRGVVPLGSVLWFEVPDDFSLTAVTRNLRTNANSGSMTLKYYKEGALVYTVTWTSGTTGAGSGSGTLPIAFAADDEFEAIIEGADGASDLTFGFRGVTT